MNSVGSCMSVTRRSLTERAQEHDKSLKECASNSALGQHQVKAGHVVISKPVTGEVRVINNEPSNTHGRVKEAIHIISDSRSHRPPADQEGTTCLTSTYTC